MNEKETAELRRRFHSQKNNIVSIKGCLVNEKGETVTAFSQPLASFTEDETEAVLSLFRKTLSGGMGKNLIDLEFPNAQVLNGQEHKRLLRLRDSALRDEEALKEVIEAIKTQVRMEGSYLILFATESYDVFTYGEDGKKSEESTHVFSYFICSVCPIKLTKPLLSFAAFDHTFKNLAANSVVSSPVLGFLFPAFDDRAANLYGTLLYTKDTYADHSALTGALFGVKPPLPASVQQEAFGSVFRESLAEDCTFEMMEGVRETVGAIIAEHKERKEPETLRLSKSEIASVLRENDADPDRIAAFEQRYDRTFGSAAKICPANIIESKKLELSSADVSIKINPDRGDLVETRVIGGVKYILIRAEEGVELNGIPIEIRES